jgi:hypothetical protein
MSPRIVAGLASGLAIGIATIAFAVAAPHGGGGGGHVGGGGGGMHVGGGGGGMHFGGGGGGMHFGGGGPHFGGGGAHFGGFSHVGGGGFRFGHGGGHLGAFHAGGFAHVHRGGLGGHVGHLGHRGALASRAHGLEPGAHGLEHGAHGVDHAGREGTAHADVGRQAAVGHQHPLGHQFERSNFDRHFGDRDRFFARHGFRRGFFGWAGPVFWPYAYDDLFDYAFWPYDYYDDYYDPFWAYGYDDLFAGIFYPADPGNLGYGYADEGSYGRHRHRHHRQASNEPTNEVVSTTAGAAELCNQEAASTVAFPFDQIQETLQLSAEQKAKLDDLRNAANQAAATLKASCPSQLAVTPIGRLETVEGRLSAMLDAVTTVSGPLHALYASLNDEQKVRFNQMSLPGDHIVGKSSGNRTKLGTECNQQATGVVQFPLDAYDKAVHPNESQRADLTDLSKAAAAAADKIKASCPAETPLTVTGRLDAMKNRLAAMLDAVRMVRTPLERFYSSLNDEQKARLNQISRQQQSAG